MLRIVEPERPLQVGRSKVREARWGRIGSAPYPLALSETRFGSI